MDFVPIGAAVPITDSPCFGAALFRDSRGLQFFTQSCTEGAGHDETNELKVNEFIHLESKISSSIVETRSNVSIRAGDTKLFALSLGKGEVVFGHREEIVSLFNEDFERFSESPYLFYQLATLSMNRKLIANSLLSPRIVSAIAKGQLNCKVPARYSQKEGTWNAGTEELLERLWNSGLSASRISKIIVGTTRNSIIGKVHRMGLGARS